MEKTFTPFDIIRFLYNETTTGEEEQIYRLIEQDEEAQATCQDYRQLMGCLDQNRERPSRQVLENVLDHARDRN